MVLLFLAIMGTLGLYFLGYNILGVTLIFAIQYTLIIGAYIFINLPSLIQGTTERLEDILE